MDGKNPWQNQEIIKDSKNWRQDAQENLHSYNMRYCCSYFDVWGVDIACVVLFSGHKLHTRIVVWQHILEAIPLCIFRQLCNAALTVGHSLWHLFILCKHLSLLQLLLQELTLKHTYSQKN